MAVLEDILLFFDPMPGALPIYERLFERAQAELGPFSVRVQKTQITWSNRHVFACASFMKVRKAKDRPKTYLVVTFGLEHKAVSPRIDVATRTLPQPLDPPCNGGVARRDRRGTDGLAAGSLRVCRRKIVGRALARPAVGRHAILATGGAASAGPCCCAACFP